MLSMWVQVMLYAVSLAYKESANCRMEASCLSVFFSYRLSAEMETELCLSRVLVRRPTMDYNRR